MDVSWITEHIQLPVQLVYIISSRTLPALTLQRLDKVLITVPRMALVLLAKAFGVSTPSVWNSLFGRQFVMRIVANMHTPLMHCHRTVDPPNLSSFLSRELSN